MLYLLGGFCGYDIINYSNSYFKVEGRFVIDENNQRKVEYSKGNDYSYLTINGVDGTTIDRSKGY